MNIVCHNTMIFRSNISKVTLEDASEPDRDTFIDLK